MKSTRLRSSSTNQVATMKMRDYLQHSAEKIRNLREHGLEEGASTRVLIYAAKTHQRRHQPAPAPVKSPLHGASQTTLRFNASIDEVVSSIFP